MQRKIFPWIDSAALVLLVVCMCTQIDLGAIGHDTLNEGFVTKRLLIALPDVMLFAVFVWFVLRTTMLGVWKKTWWPPFPCFALIACMILSIVHSNQLVQAVQNSLIDVHGFGAIVKAILTTKEFKEAIADTVQWTGYFISAPLVFVNLIYDRSGEKVLLRRRLALVSFTIGVALTIMVHLISTSVLAERWFSSPNAYAGFLAISIPLILAKVLSHRTPDTAKLWGTGFLGASALLTALCTMISLWAITAMILGIVIAGFVYKARARTTAIIIVSLILAVTLWPQQGERNFNRLRTWHVPSETQPVKKEYIEWYVAARRTVDRRMHAFATGVGAGNYQFSIGSYYARLPNEEKMPPDSNNLYLVIVNTLGILGLAALFWMLGYFFKRAYEAFRLNPNDWLGVGVMGFLAAFLFVNNFHALIVRGTGIVLAFALSLAIVAKLQALESKKS